MLSKILTQNDCADCRLCCAFYENEIWEVPVIDDKLADLINEKYDFLYDFDFIKNNRVFKVIYDDKGLCYCKALGDGGCKLGKDKPFDCKIWPFRAMRLGEYTVITVSPLCKKINELSLSEVSKFVTEELAEIIKAQVLKEPETVKDYVYDYPILKVL